MFNPINRRTLRAIRCLALVPGAAVLFCGCAGLGELKEARAVMNLQRDAPTSGAPAAKVTHITVRNGAGKILFDGAPDASGRISARPPLADLDGTLRITEKLSDGSERVQELKHPSGEWINLTWNPQLGRFGYISASTTPYRIGVRGIAARFEMPAVGAGTLFDGGTERALAKTESKLDASGLGLTLGSPVGRFGLEWLDGSASSSAEEPIGARGVAYTYDRTAPNGSTGVSAGATGQRARVDTDWNRLRARYVLDPGKGRGLHHVELADGGESIVAPLVILSREQWKYRGITQSLTFADITSRFDKKVTDDYVGLGLTGRRVFHKSDESEAYFGGELLLGRHNAKYSGLQINRCGLCPVAEQNFAVSTSDRLNKTSWSGALGVGGRHRFGNLWVGGKLEYRFDADMPALRNPANPNEAPPRLDFDKRGATLASVTLQYRF